MIMENSSVSRRTRLQEKNFFQKYYEEKCGKKLRKREVTHVNSRGFYKDSWKEKGGKRDKDLKRKRGSEGSDDNEDAVVCLGDKPLIGSLCSTKNKGLDEKWNSGDNNGDIVILAEEVVSNHNSSIEPSSFGSGMNSGCARGEKSSIESPEVVSSCLRGEGECILISEDSCESKGLEDEDDKCSELEVSTEVDNDDFIEGAEEDASVTSIGEEEEEEEEEENDDGYVDARVDGKTCLSRNGESNVVEELNVDNLFLHDGKNGESNEISMEGKYMGKKQKQVIEDGLIRQKVYGMDILSTCNKKGDKMGEGIGKRLRSRLLSKAKRKILKLGTISHPLVVDDKQESSSDSEDKRPPEVNYKCESSSDTEDIIEYLTDSEDKLESSSEEDKNIICKNKVINEETGIQIKKIRTKFRKRKIKKKSTSNSLDLAKVISEKIWQEASSVQGKKHIKLPLKFTFEDENPVVQEKEEWEKENEALFDEMEFALKAIRIGSFGPSMGETSDMVFSETEPEPKAIDLCHKGKHNLKLEEEIGMICINCSYVLEMKYIFPDFAKDPFRRWEKQNLSADAETNRSFVDRLKFLNCFSKGNSTSVNVEGTVWDLIPGMKEKMYPHQHEGFEFIWEHLAGGISLEKLSLSKSLANERNGCIINHAPGTGKTCLVIVFLLSFMRLHQKCRPVIVAPLSMLRNWEEEFHKWNVNIPFYNLNERLTKKESEKANRLFENVVLDNNCSRLLKLCFWRQEQSVLAISYQLFVLLTGEQGKSVIGEKNEKAENGFIRKILREFSDILVLDEGHTARNDNTKMWKALSEVKTKRKIILSGTLFQNNFTELYNTLCLANSKFADQMSSKFANQMNKSRGLRKRHMQACDLEKDEWLSLTNSIVWKGDDRSKLKQMNYPFVHVYKGAILLELPGIKDSRIDLRPTALQTKLFNKVKKVPNYLRRKSLMSLVSIHPSLVSDCDEFSEDERRYLEKHVSSPDAGVKTKFVFELIGLCEALRERVLIFCSYVKPLKLIMKQLKLQFNWLEGRELLQMDGSADQERRKSIISLMNDPNSNVRVLLASTKASNEGINLVGASRVVFLDVGFNPSVESQAISRAYRIGQKKVVYVYHLVTSGTLEVDNYHSQNLKENISKLVFSSKNSSGCCGASNGETVSPQAAVLEDKVLESMVQHVNLKNMFEQIYERPRTD